MNCGPILELLLEADPAELAGQGDSVLARHLRACDRCRAVARQILADTKRLELAIGARVAASVRPIEAGAPRPSGARQRLVAVLLAAAAAGIAVLREAGDAVEQTGSWRTARTVVARVPDQTTRATRPTSRNVMRLERAASTRPAASGAARRVVPVPVAAAEFPKAAPVAPAQFALSNAEEETRMPAAEAAGLDPAPGKRVAILRAGDPTVTVYWLY